MPYIKKELLLADISDARIKNVKKISHIALDIFKEMIEKQPTYDVEELRHGEWEFVFATRCSKTSGCEIGRGYVCSLCKRVSDEKTNYCHCCGAKMER